MDAELELPVSYVTGLLVILGFILTFLYFYIKRPGTVSELVEENTVASATTLPNEDEQERRSLTAKQRKKQELKEARRRQRMLLDEERKEKEKLKQEREEIYEKRREEKERQRQEDEIKRAELAYETYKDIVSSFVVEKEGNIQEQERISVDDFVNFVIQKKMTSIVELAAKFDMHHKDVADRLNQLEDQGRLFGLLDERGRYLYISDSELDALDRYINKGGRIHKYVGLTPFCNATIAIDQTK
ncbi:DDRGK domain-containing protein 1 [Babesia sp. Xinjiang]|uniref:DDRGK domain-containing protein 1 n=1 Tax=Babesia sp. Xinjiang TaxID=462227 RepID=UPI000A252F02|nr:DDRGK domain-containing protein 1 [Babesia sp. Xinjiang]ORM41240.1 DDRGK domain-containing protein 1 [Babesia sp. Xinjiang]